MLPIARSNSSRSVYGSQRIAGNAAGRWKLLSLLLAGVLAACLVVFVFSSARATGRHGARPQHRRLRANALVGTMSEGQDGPAQLFGSSSEGGEAQAAIPSIDSSKVSADAAEEAAIAKIEAAKKAAAFPLPPDFDWQSYILYHPELQDVGILSEEQAKEHYQQIGGRKKLLHRRIRVIMRYTACTGLVNQLYSHIAALSLAAFLGAEVVLPPAAKRDSFAHYFSVYKEQNEVLWTSAPLESLLDVDHLIHFWANRGMRIHKAQALEPFPDLTEPENAFLQHSFAGGDERCTTRMGDVYLQHLEMEELIERARRAVVERAEALARSEQNFTAEHMVLDLPCTFFMLRSASNIRLAAEVAKSLQWSAEVQRLSDRVIAGIEKAGDAGFNSVHLRIEKDARDWATIMGGEAIVWANYVEAMKQAGFNGGRGLYIASGLLTYGANDELDRLVTTMRNEGLCRSAHYKELYLPKSEIEALNSEQKALLDLLVLAKGYSFVGFGSSTFSFYLREYRLLIGVPAARSILVDASVIGTDQLFADAGRIT